MATEFNIPPTEDNMALVSSSTDTFYSNLHIHREAVEKAINQIGMREVLIICRNYAIKMIANKQVRDASFYRWNGMRNRLVKLVDWSWN